MRKYSRAGARTTWSRGLGDRPAALLRLRPPGSHQNGATNPAPRLADGESRSNVTCNPFPRRNDSRPSCPACRFRVELQGVTTSLHAHFAIQPDYALNDLAVLASYRWRPALALQVGAGRRFTSRYGARANCARS